MKCAECDSELDLDEMFITLYGELAVMCNVCGRVKFLGWPDEQ